MDRLKRTVSPQEQPQQEQQRSLYRRHRPRTFAEVVGQEPVVRTLRNAVERGKVHNPEELRDQQLDCLRDAAALVEDKATAEELDDYRRFVLAVANKVAAAHREGGEQVSPPEQQAIDLYHFTARLNRSLDEQGRARVVEMMWQIVFADGTVTEFEDNLIWRAADLLGISRHERIALRERVAGSSVAGSETGQ